MYGIAKPQSHERNIVALPNSFNLTNSILDNPEYDTEDVVYYDTIEECFQAVLSGSADCTYADNYNANYLLSQVKYRNLSSTTLTAMTEDASFGLSDQCDPRLLSIINKGLACISSEQLDSIVLQNCSYRENPSLFNPCLCLSAHFHSDYSGSQYGTALTAAGYSADP